MKIYKSANLPAVTETNIVLQAGSALEYIPDATIAYQQAHYKQETVVRMEQGATFLYADHTGLGGRWNLVSLRYDPIKAARLLRGRINLVRSSEAPA